MSVFIKTFCNKKHEFNSRIHPHPEKTGRVLRALQFSCGIYCIENNIKCIRCKLFNSCNLEAHNKIKELI